MEETVCRGLILKTLLNKSVQSAAITSSILFSITHMLNVMSGQSTEQTILQLVYAHLVGCALALLMVKNNNIFSVDPIPFSA
ncbi:CPBP family intramembrane glutamic endopeptidase [Paenibacillus sepulcri]|uniref:CPBP family intramembrane glutamic endopeptidase n=1 Tax=Paenibacillus sepulcri TaxID=359917 RepID=UPI0035ECDF62